jgi:pilus assembly protein FimV
VGDNTFKPWLLAASIAALLTPCVADAAGLGRLAVLSALGQPLNAEIELLSVQKGESIAAKLASVDTYQQANLPYNPALVGTRVTIEKRPNGQLYLKATTPRAINEPFVELVVELNSEHGRVTRQYTVLLDPPGYGRGAPAVPPVAAARRSAPVSAAEPPAISPPAVAAAPEPEVPAQETLAAPAEEAMAAPAQEGAAAPAPAEQSPSPFTEAVPEPATPESIAAAPSTPELTAAAPTLPEPVSSAERAPDSAAAAPRLATRPSDPYGPVKPGETLYRIARSIKPEGATIEQTLVGLYRRNPDAFIKKNMNLVKSGKILRVPNPDELAAVPQREAMQELHVQVADFHAMRTKLADSAGTAREDGSATSGRIGARIAEPGASAPRDTVRLSKGEPPSGKAARSGNTADRVRALEEEAVAREKALADANERIAQLEKTIKDMQRLTELKNSGTSAPQQQSAGKSAGAQQAAPGVKGGIPTASVIAPPPAVEPPRGATASGTGKSALPESPKIAASDSANTAPGGDVAKSATPQPKPAPVAAKDKVDPAAPVRASEDLLETVMNEPLYLAGGAALLLGGLGVMIVRRRRKSGKQDKYVDMTGAPRTGPGGAAAKAGAAASAVPGDGGKWEPRVIRTETPAVANRFVDDEEVEEPRNRGGWQQEKPEEAADDHAAEPDLNVYNREQVEEEPPVRMRNFGDDDAPTMQPDSAAMHDDSDSASAQPTRHSNVMDFNIDPLPSIETSGDTMLGERVASVADAPLDDFKLDDLDLNLGGSPAASGKGKDDHWYDVQQKFDLAKAYEEMGDKDGAREILQEVVREGDSDQQAQAGKLLESLS